MSATIKVRRGLKANLPTLAQGEIGFTTDTHETYIGDGTTNYLIGGGDTGSSGLYGGTVEDEMLLFANQIYIEGQTSFQLDGNSIDKLCVCNFVENIHLPHMTDNIPNGSRIGIYSKNGNMKIYSANNKLILNDDTFALLVFLDNNWIVIDISYELINKNMASDEKAYVMAGKDLKNYEYCQDSWTRKIDIPTSSFNAIYAPNSFNNKQIYAPTSCGIFGKIYLISGYHLVEGQNYPQNTVTNLEYLNTLDIWTFKTDMPSPGRNEAISTTISNKGYVFAGRDDDNYFHDTNEYTPDTWASKTNMLSPSRCRLAASTILNKGYVYGGYDGVYSSQNCDEYTPDTWISKTDMPLPSRYSLAASTILNKGYIYGGDDGSNRLQDCDEYTPDTWTSKTSMPSPSRNRLAASTILNKGYIYGGYDSGDLLDCDEYTPDIWVSKTDIPNEKSHHTACTI